MQESVNGHQGYVLGTQAEEEDDYRRFIAGVKTAVAEERAEAAQTPPPEQEAEAAPGLSSYIRSLDVGRLEQVKPILMRSDGEPLMYQGKLNTIYGSPASGKSWIALLAIQEVSHTGWTRRILGF